VSIEAEGGLEELLQHLKDTRGFDFTGYKQASLQRRIGKRMTQVGTGTPSEYLDYLEVHPDEFARLFDMILINVTGFFRDPAAWEFVSSVAVSRLLANKGDRAAIRVWTAGCASGEEAYTMAMILAEAVGVEGFVGRVKVYATDADEDALATARHGVYSAKEVEGVPPELIEKYFEQEGSRFAFRKDLRRSVIFGRHDLVQDAPISRLDLLVCRNTLMYFNADLQARILRNFHFALNERGLLFLGKAETMLTHTHLFTPIDLRYRLFEKTTKSSVHERVFGIPAPPTEMGGLARHVQLRDAAIDSAPMAQLLVDVDGMLIGTNEMARMLFGLGTTDIGRRLQDLEVSYRPLELRSRIETAYNDRRPVSVSNVEQGHGNGDVQSFDVTIAPVLDADAEPVGVTISFADVTRYRRLRGELERSNQELETAYEELQSTNEELETTNEELQSTVEELETTNEELQSANEELETANEELQSTNSEVQAINEEMGQQRHDLNRMVSFSHSVLGSLHLGVIVVDRKQRIQNWNDRAEDMWGLRAAEVADKEIGSLDIGLAVGELVEPIERCLNGMPQTLEMAAMNRRGQQVQCQIRCNPLVDPDGTIQGAVVLIEETT
jgi:two-component system CheB/CheR fusion protein